jgi:predicted nucleic acid-binding protein
MEAKNDPSEHAVTGRHIFDAHLVATMLGNGLTRLYTLNRIDFECFLVVDALTPTTP